MPPAVDRVPAPEEPFWPDKETLPSAEELKARGVKLEMFCGRPGKELIYAAEGYGALPKTGYAWSGWSLPVYHARAGKEQVEIELSVPPGTAGLVRVCVIDPDNFEGGRKQVVNIADADVATMTGFQEGKWIERRLNSEQTSSGKVLVRATNARQGSNAVISIIEWVEK